MSPAERGVQVFRRTFPHLAAVVLALATALPARAEVDLTPAELRDQAARTVTAGLPAAALPMTEALLARDAEDVEALVIRARALRDLGRYDDAMATARRAWAAAGSDTERYAAALVMAQARASAGQRTMSQIWLRRAVEHAPSETARARAVRDFRYVRARNDWATDLSFNIAPTSNLNNGSVRSSTRLFDLPFEFELSGDAQALSGTEISGGFSTRYRLSEDRSHRTDLLLRAEHRTYVLSEDARDKAPGRSGSDYAFSSLAAGLTHRGALPDGPGPYQLWVTGGRNWYGGEPYFDALRLGAQQSVTLSRDSRAFVTLGREYQSGHGTRDDARVWSLGAGIDRRLPSGADLRLSVSARFAASENTNLDYRRIGARIDYALAEPVMGVDLEFGLSAAKKDHETSSLSSAGRHDTEWAASVTAVFPEIDLYGFVPSLTYSWRSTASNIGLFDSREHGLEMGIRSAF